MCLSSVVLPDPKKPVSIVTGTGDDDGGRLVSCVDDGDEFKCSLLSLLFEGVFVSTSNSVGTSSSLESDIMII